MVKRLLISIDDTDTVGGEGTGRLARRIVRELGLEVEGITRHQLFIHHSIKYTKRNSCNVIIANADSDVLDLVREIIERRFQDGSDPGLAIADMIPKSIQEFGRDAQRKVISKSEAMVVAREANIHLEELGGTGDGVIGALAGLGLCASGEDGRYIMLPNMRELRGPATVERLGEIGIRVIVLDSGKKLEEGEVIMSDRIRPSRISGEPILFVKEGEGACYPVVL
jgi:tRNA(Ile2) C34 agmatinyltransferase TiaS